MTEEKIKKQGRSLRRKTIELMDEECYCCGSAEGKLAKYATAQGFDVGGLKIVKSVYDCIYEKELKEFMKMCEAPHEENVKLSIWFWSSEKPYAKKPFDRMKLRYNKPEQRYPERFEKLVKK